MYPKDLKYTKTHEWVRIEESGENTAVIGLSEFAIKQLSDIVFLELPTGGDSLKKGSPFGAIESVKAVFDLNAPLTSQVVEVNEDLPDDLELLQQDPYTQGWMIKVKMENKNEISDLMNAADYETFVKHNE